MQLFDYLEYMTHNERIKAAKNGQTNLSNSKELGYNDRDVSFIRQRNEIRQYAEENGIKVNNFRKFRLERIVILSDGTFGSANANDAVHDDIIEYFYYECKLPKNMQVGPLSKWNRENKYFKHFLCIQYDERINHRIKQSAAFFSESYLPEIVDSISSSLFNKYKKICKEKIGLELKQESYLKAQEDYLGVKYA